MPRPGAKPKIKQLLSDIEPFFYGRPVVYVDVGAHKGDTFREVHVSSLNLRVAHLFEPNPRSFAALEATVRELGAEEVATCHNVALAATPQRLRLRDADTMTKVIGATGSPDATDNLGTFEVEAATLDTLLQALVYPRVSILKVDVEGYEREVFAGAATLLGRQAIDLIYVEAGIDPANMQQTYYRDVEDVLRAQGYRLFRIYEQANEWIEDSPLLRRVNLAFFSEAFAAKNPYNLSRELFTVRGNYRALKQTLADEQAATVAARDEAQERIRALADQVAASRASHEAQERESTQRAEALQRELDAVCQEAEEQDVQAQTLVVALDACKAESARSHDALQREIDALREEVVTREAESAAKTVALRTARASQKAVMDEATRLRGYAADLEQRLGELLGSTTWTAMEPVRRVVRLVRRQEAPPRFVPTLGAACRMEPPEAKAGNPQNTKPAGSSSVLESTRDSLSFALQPREASGNGASLLSQAAHDLMRQSGRMSLREMTKVERHLTSQPDSDGNFFLSKFARMLMYSRYSSYSEVAEAVDSITGRLGSDLHWIEDNLDSKVLIRFTLTAASALTRCQRYAEARQLIDQVIVRHAKNSDLLRFRAQMCWPHDPDQARSDLAVCAQRGELSGNWLLLQAYLERHDEPRISNAIVPSSELDQGGQMGLVQAVVALECGNFGAYRGKVNAFFEEQGLLAPLSSDATRFEFAKLGLQSVDTRPQAAEPRVSVIMTTFNAAETVGYAVRSILSQTHANVELFIVDDCSPDSTRAVLAGLAATDPRIRVLHSQANVGTYLAKNQAMEQATGRYVTFHDSDDWAHPERIARHVQLMEESRDLVASRSEWLRVSDEGQIKLHRWSCRFQHANPASMFVRREAIEAIGYFDGVRYGADTEYWYRLYQRFGADRTKTLRLCLGLGAFHAQSLTQSGSGAMGLENYSPIRGAYAASYMEWHATTALDALKRPSAPKDRAFWAPAEMVVELTPPSHVDLEI